MGSEAGRPSSRPPQLKDIVELCRALNEAGARYVLVGGFAVILHGYARGTMDVDLLIDPSPENVRKIKSALSILPDNAAAEIDDGDVERYTVVRVADDIVVDLLGRAGDVSFAEVASQTLKKTIDGVPIPYADARSLARTKDTVRPKDRQDVLFLRRKLEGGLRD